MRGVDRAACCATTLFFSSGLRMPMIHGLPSRSPMMRLSPPAMTIACVDAAATAGSRCRGRTA